MPFHYSNWLMHLHLWGEHALGLRALELIFPPHSFAIIPTLTSAAFSSTSNGDWRIAIKVGPFYQIAPQKIKHEIEILTRNVAHRVRPILSGQFRFITGHRWLPFVFS
jgi:hypothetical protein